MHRNSAQQYLSPCINQRCPEPLDLTLHPGTLEPWRWQSISKRGYENINAAGHRSASLGHVKLAQRMERRDPGTVSRPEWVGGRGSRVTRMLGMVDVGGGGGVCNAQPQ